MNKVRDGLKQDAIVIEEANDIIEKTSNGFFVYKVNSTASNEHVEDLKKIKNLMIERTKETLDKINITREEIILNQNMTMLWMIKEFMEI